MWPFTISNRTCALKLQKSFNVKLNHAGLYGLSPLDVVNDDYLLGYIMAEQAVNIEYYCKRRKPGPTAEVMLYLLTHEVGEETALKSLETVDKGLREENQHKDLFFGYRMGNMVTRVFFGESSFDYDEDVREAKLQAPKLRAKADLANESTNSLVFLLLDRKFFDAYIWENFATDEIASLKEKNANMLLSSTENTPPDN